MLLIRNWLMLCCKWTLPLPGNADLSEILQNSEESWIQKRNIEPNLVYLNVCFHFCSWDKDNEAINNIRQKSLDVRDKFLTVEEHRSEVPLSGQNPENRQLKLTKLLTKLQLFLNDPEQNQELVKGDTLKDSQDSLSFLEEITESLEILEILSWTSGFSFYPNDFPRFRNALKDNLVR